MNKGLALPADSLAQLNQQLGAVVPPDLLNLALTHPSAVGEGIERTLRSNQRLEFLGDAVVGLVAAEHFYRSDVLLPEGDLTQRKAAVVKRSSLAEAARRLDLGRYLHLGRGEAVSGGRARDTMLCDVFEALVGALFLAHGLDAARTFVLGALSEELAAVAGESINIKNRLQERTQAIGLGTPVYRTLEVNRPGHEHRFASEVLLLSEVRGRGRGKTKKDAECQAAGVALEAVEAASAGV